MRKYFKLSGQMNDDLANRFTEILNDPAEELVIFFSSGGGFCNVELIMREAVRDTLSTGRKVKLVFHNFIGSSAFSLLFDLPREAVSYIPEQIIGMTHLPFIDVELNALGEGDGSFHKSRVVHIKTLKGPAITRASRIGLSASEMKKFRNGGDVYMQTPRMIRLLKQNKVEEFK
jgi:hypothetical protein